MQSWALGWTIIILFVVNIMYTLVYMYMYIYDQVLQEKMYKADKTALGDPETDWDFSQNWGFEVQ
jgi:hypothetical protein